VVSPAGDRSGTGYVAVSQDTPRWRAPAPSEVVEQSEQGASPIVCGSTARIGFSKAATPWLWGFEPQFERTLPESCEEPSRPEGLRKAETIPRP
jgi:hypothetical protein